MSQPGLKKFFLLESSVDAISRNTIYVKHEIHKWQISLFSKVLSDKNVNISVISQENTEIMWICYEREFMP